MQLNPVQKQELFDDGFTLLRGAVSPLLVNNALKAINHSLGQEGMHPDELPTLRSQTYCREITNTPAVSDLINASPVISICENLLGEGNVNPVGRGQVALRFPSSAVKAGKNFPHLDGTYTPDNGVQPGSYATFTMLVGVFLSDLPEPDMGNFTVWPGTHRIYEKYFQENGIEKFLEGTPQIDLPPPRQLLVKAGDVAVCHYLIGHSAAANLSPFIRYATFFRIIHKEHEVHRSEILADIWRDWPGMAEIAGAG